MDAEAETGKKTKEEIQCEKKITAQRLQYSSEIKSKVNWYSVLLARLPDAQLIEY